MFAAAPGSPFSAGVRANPGFRLERAVLSTALRVEAGLDLIANHCDAQHVPRNNLAGIELLAPAVMSRAEFAAFNTTYVAGLRSRRLIGDGAVPVARSMVVPADETPRTAMLTAFTYVVPVTHGPGGHDFLLSGTPEVAHDPDRVIAPGDTSATGLAIKARHVIAQLQATARQLGADWSEITTAQVYCLHPLDTVLPILRAAHLADRQIVVVRAAPPVIGYGNVAYEFETDIRAISGQHVV